MKITGFELKIPTIRRRAAQRPLPGSPPGTLAVREGLPGATLRKYTFSQTDYRVEELLPDALEAAFAPVEGSTVWVDVRGLGDGPAIQAIGKVLGLHALTVEDIVHTHQRPKLEVFEEHLYIVLRMVRALEDDAVDNEQFSLVLKKNLLITFQERPGDVFDPVRRRLAEDQGSIRRGGADYLAYSLIDAIVDNYYPVIDAYLDTMDQLDEAVRESPTSDLSRAIHRIRRELRQLRRAVSPLRDVLATLSRPGLALISEPVLPPFRDCHDHVLHVSDAVEGGRERAAELADLHLTMTGERTNQVMKVLTIISTIFIPLTFLCGVYGMNFDPASSPYNMPELRWRFGYPALWAVMIVVIVSMLWMFRRKGWMGGSGETKSRGGLSE